MIDKEKVLEELECLSEWLFQQYQVVYDGDAPNYYDAYKTVDDAIALLKERKPVRPIEQTETITRYKCGFCGNRLYLKEHKFCHWCGKAVKWDE